MSNRRLKKGEFANVVYIACLTSHGIQETIKRRIADGEQLDSFWTSVYESWKTIANNLMGLVQRSILRDEMDTNNAAWIGSVYVNHMKDFDFDIQDKAFSRWPWKAKDGKLLSWNEYRKLKPEEKYNKDNPE